MTNKRFDYDSIQDNETVSKYLESFVNGFKKGKISLKSREHSMELEPNNILQFSVSSEKKERKSKIVIKISWTDADQAGGSDNFIEIE